MKLLAAVVFGLVAIAVGSEDYSHHYGSHQNQVNDNAHEYLNKREENQGDWHGQRSSQAEYDDYRWNVQISHGKNYRYQQSEQNIQGSSIGGLLYPKYNSVESEQQYGQGNQHYGLSSSFESISQEGPVKDQQTYGEVATEIGRAVAQKMVKLFYIVEAYVARNGIVQAIQNQEPFTLRQWSMPMANHQFLKMSESKVYGLGQGIIKQMYFSTEKNIVDMEYFFNSLLVKGDLKPSTGAPQRPFNLKITNTYVNVTTNLKSGHYIRNEEHSRNGETELDYHNTLGDGLQSISNEDIASKYVELVNRAVEREMFNSSKVGLVGCLRSEIESTFEVPSTIRSDLLIENKKSQLTVALVRTQTRYSEGKISSQPKKVNYVVFRQKQAGNGYQLEAEVVLASQPQWTSDVVIDQKGHQRITVPNVKFHAQNIVATVVINRVQLPNGEYQFVVKNARVWFQGLGYETENFNLVKTAENDNLVREVGKNLQSILENNMSGALQEQLYQQQLYQQQIFQENPMDLIRCNK